MVPNRDGRANQGHACVKGRFAYGYATHADRVTTPMIRERITDPWREVSWDEAIDYAASRVQAHPGAVRPRFHRRHHLVALHERGNLPGAEAGARGVRHQQRRYLRARLPFAHRLRAQAHAGRIGGHAGIRSRSASRRHHGHRREPHGGASGVRLADEAAPARRARSSSSSIRARSRWCKSPHVEADYHLRLLPGTNVAVINALAHVMVTEGLTKEDYIAERCEAESYEKWKEFVADPRNSPEATETVTGVPAELVRGAARLYATGRQQRYLLRPRRHRAQPGHDHGDGHRQSRDGHRQSRPRRRGRESAARPEQRAGLLRHGLVPARVQRLPPCLG